MSSKIYILILILTLGAVSASALAETVYVNDILRVGVRDTPTSSGVPHAVVITGMRLQVLEHSGAYIKIRSDKGVEGWIKSTYVTPNKPATLQLADLQAQQKKLEAKLTSQAKLIEQGDAKAKAMSQELQKLKQGNARLHKRLGVVRQTRSQRDDHYLAIGGGLILLTIGGFVAGAAWHRKMAMRRLGGLRV